MDKMKRKYQQAKGKVKDLLRPPSHQSALATPARSARSSQDPTATHYQAISATSSAVVLVSQGAVAPTADATPTAEIPALETPAPEPSPQPESTPNYAETYLEPVVKTQGDERGAFEAEELKEKPENAITAGWSLL